MALGAPSHGGGQQREMFLDGFFVDYDASERVEFIELAHCGLFCSSFRGVDLHAVPVEEAVAFVSRYAAYDKLDPELGYSFIFPELQLSFWRGLVPSLERSSEDNAGRTFEAVGIGVAGYFSPSKAA